MRLRDRQYAARVERCRGGASRREQRGRGGRGTGRDTLRSVHAAGEAKLLRASLPVSSLRVTTPLPAVRSRGPVVVGGVGRESWRPANVTLEGRLPRGRATHTTAPGSGN